MFQSVFCQGDVNDHAVNTFDSNPVADGVACGKKEINGYGIPNFKLRDVKGKVQHISS
jgi:hypothetical protein